MKIHMCKRRKSLPKYCCIFLCLVLFVLTFIIDIMDILEDKVKSMIHIAPAKRHHDFCAFKPRSLKEAREEHLILKSIAWPETPPLYHLHLSKTSDPAHSTFTILPGRGGGQWYKGDKLEVLIKMYDFTARPKKTGGDVLLARLHNPILAAGVVGQVVDHLNGSYSAVFYLPWEGSAQVEKFSDDSAVLGCIREGDEDEQRTVVDNFVIWCKQNHLQINVTKTKELVVDIRWTKTPVTPVSINGACVETVKDYKYLCVHIDSKLDFFKHTDAIYKNGQSRLYFPR